MNKAILIGNLGKDPELKYTQHGQAICNFSVALNESYTDKNGQKVDKTEWASIVCFGKAAESCGEYLHKGSQVCVEGKLQTRSYEKDGVTMYRTEVIAERVNFL